MRGARDVVVDGNPPGEHVFTASGLFLSLHLGQFLQLEQQTTDRLWRGSSIRGDIKVMLPGEDRTFRHSRPAQFAHLTIDHSWIESSGITPSTLFSHVQLQDAPLRHMVEALLAEARIGPVTQMFQDAAQLAILARLSVLNHPLQPQARAGLGPARLRRTLELIEDCLDADLSIRDLAQAQGMSPAHFAAMFKASVGEPPHKYQIRRRVERARDLLLSGSTPADAALAVGFYDQSHLSRHMRRLLGRTPAAIRNLRTI